MTESKSYEFLDARFRGHDGAGGHDGSGGHDGLIGWNMTEESKTLASPDFSSLILSIASTALLKLGLDSKNPHEKDLNMARYNIDLLILLKEKTKNNLSKEESQLLESCISDLQIQFINKQNEEKEKKWKLCYLVC